MKTGFTRFDAKDGSGQLTLPRRLSSKPSPKRIHLLLRTLLFRLPIITASPSIVPLQDDRHLGHDRLGRAVGRWTGGRYLAQEAGEDRHVSMSMVALMDGERET